MDKTLNMGNTKLKKVKIETVQINLGNKCNLTCSHCHIDASTAGKRNMDYETAKKIVNKLMHLDVKNVEFTGGAPELNPNLRYFIKEFSRHNHKSLAVRTNLTVLDLPDYSFYIGLFKKYAVKIIASVPGVFEGPADKQRGKGVFQKSLKIIKKLNKIGYGTNGLLLNHVYNPVSDFLPPDQSKLETEHKLVLKDKYGISFNNLIVIVNSPIKRFKSFLQQEGRLDGYMELLKKNYNPLTLDNVMCRSLISVDYRGYVYDCDFNLALGMKIKGYEDKKFWDMDFENFNPGISFDDHCYACTVNRGSSCSGELIKKQEAERNPDDKVFDVKGNVKKYYGEELKSSSDLKTDVCCRLRVFPNT